jgi:hypothetical protein
MALTINVELKGINDFLLSVLFSISKDICSWNSAIDSLKVGNTP